MAVIGARRANGFDVLLRRPRQRPRPQPARARARSSAHRREIGNVTGFLLAIAAAAALALFYLSQSTHVAATGYELDALQTRVQQLNRQQQQLVLQIGEARAPAQIQSLAKSQLQLVPLNQKSVQFAPQPETAGLNGAAFDVPRAHRAAHQIER